MTDTNLSSTEPNGVTAEGAPVPPLEGVTPVSPEGVEAIREIEAEGAATRGAGRDDVDPDLAAAAEAPVKMPSEVPVTSAPTPGTSQGSITVEDVEEALRDVVDPELGINVVDLGLVYGVTVDRDNHAVIDMTLTSAACPLTDVIEDQTSQALEGLVNGHRLNWVWMPPWGPDKITDDGREQLRALGFNI